MTTDKNKVANALYESGCVKFGAFKIKSGAISPYYIDMARLLSNPKQLCIIAEVAAKSIRQIMASEQINKLASIELKGALIAPSIACKLDLPCVIVRKEDKAYGVTGRIAGADVVADDNLLFFDDVVSEGLSKIEGVKPLTELGGKVKHLMVVVNREQGGKEKLEAAGFQVHALTKISQVVEALQESGKITSHQAQIVLSYIKNPNSG
ncbi:MAG: orotate phosphoribosyltransferase [Candidatus Bathyarchaeota archaeon]|nr:orotate phosphoribosyltransferase [Candidatus Bathyarchaeota archaeon]